MFGDWKTVFIVIALDDSGETYVQVTRRRFAIRSDAETYAKGVATSRKPVVVEVPR